MMRISLEQWLLIALAVAAGAGGSLFLKLGATRIDVTNKQGIDFFLHIATNVHLLAGIGLYLVPSFLAVALLRTMDLSVLQPALSLTYVATAFLAFLVLNEPVSVERWIGISLIVFGVVLVAKS